MGNDVPGLRLCNQAINPLQAFDTNEADIDEFRSGIDYHNNYVVKETGQRVKEAYFPLECVPGQFKFQLVIKFVSSEE